MKIKRLSLEKTDKIALAFLLGTSLFYGLLIVIQKKGLNEGLDPLSFSFSRSLLVVIISLLFFSPKLKELKSIRKYELIPMSILVVASAASILILFLGQEVTTALNASFLIRLTPLFVLPLAYILLREKSSRSSVFFMLIMLCGAFLLITNGVMIIPCFGDLLIIFVAMIIAFQNVFAKKIMRTVSTDVVILCRACLSSLIIVMFIPLLFGIQGRIIAFNGLFYPTVTGVLYFLSVFCQYNAIKLIGPFITTAFFLSGSLFSALLAYLLLGETLSLIQWIGVVSILIGGFSIINKTRMEENDG